MTMFNRWVRRAGSVFGVAVAALLVTTLVPTAAHATLGAAQGIDIQLTTISNGNIYKVGRVYGTVQWDDGNTQYRLDVTVCRQSSYTSPNVRLFVNGVAGGAYSGEDNVNRSSICGGPWGLSYAISGTFTAGGAVVRGLGIGIATVFFDGSSARDVGGGGFYDNPYN